MRSRILILFSLLAGFTLPGFAQTQLIADGSFAASSFGPWILSGGGNIVTSTNAYPGDTAYLSLGGIAGATEMAAQIITFPTNMIASTISIADEVLTSDTLGTDILAIYIEDLNNNPLVKLAQTSNQNPPLPEWLVGSTNWQTYPGGGVLSAFAGQTVQLAFYVQTDPTYGYLTTFNIDNVSLIAATTANIPPNDVFSNATVILGDTATTLVNTTYASLDPGQPEIAGYPGNHSVWWTFTAPSIGTVAISTTGSAFNTILAAYTGTNLTALTNVIASDGVTNESGLASFRFNVLRPGTVFQFALDGYKGQYGAAQVNFTFTPDTTLPIVAFTSPKTGADVTNASVVLHGTASDNVGVAEVYYRLTNSAGTNAFAAVTALTNAASTNAFAFGTDIADWAVTITNLVLGPNTIFLEAVDTSSNVSASVGRVINYVLSAPLGLSTNGRGTISLSGASIVASPTNGQLLNIGYNYVLTAKAAAGFAFTNWTGSQATNKAALSFMMAPDLAFTANFVETQKPVLSVTAPLAAQHWSNSTFTVTGKASDLVGVSNVWFQFNGSAWSTNVSSTNNWTNWSIPVTLTSGANTTSTNVFKAFAEDAAGNCSMTNAVTFYYVESDRARVDFTGLGAVSPNYSNVLLQLGRTLTMTASPGKTSVFSNWSDGAGVVLTNGPELKFVMASNLELIANFIPNPFYVAAGTYEGLFYNTNGFAQNSSGYLSAQVNSNGSFTVRFQQGVSSYSLSGQFSLTGAWTTNAVKAWSNTAVSLQLDLTDGRLLAGGLTNAGWSAQVWGDRGVWSKNHPAPQAGTYTLVLPGTNSGVAPEGDGFGSVTVSPLGALAFSGTLGDGAKVTQSALLSEQGLWPFFVADGTAGGMALGWLTLANETNTDIDGWVNWFKPAQASSAIYKGGFTNALEAAGSAYSLPRGARILNLTNGAVSLDDQTSLQYLSQPLPITTDEFFLRSNNLVAGSNKLTLTFTTTSGLFHGAATNAAGKTVTFSGAVLQKQNAGYGLFLDTNRSGSVTIAPAAP